MHILGILTIIIEEVALLGLVASELAHDIITLSCGLSLVLGDQEIRCLIKWALLREQDTHTLLSRFLQVEVELWVQHCEA